MQLLMVLCTLELLLLLDESENAYVAKLCYLFQNQVSDQFPLHSVLSSMCLVATYFDNHMAFSNILDILCFAGVLRIMTEMFLPHISLADVEQTFFSKVLPKV